MKLIKRENNIYFASPEALEIRDRNQMLKTLYHQDKQWKEIKSCTACSPSSQHFDRDQKYNLKGQGK